MKKLSVILIILLFALPVMAEEEYDFRDVKWSMTKSEVKENENAEFLEEDDSGLLYKTNIKNNKVYLLYTFAYGELAQAIYSFEIKHTNLNLYADDYWAYFNLLKDKYGKPEIKEEIWKNDLYKGDPYNEGMAIALGHKILYATWETEKTRITIKLVGDNAEIHLYIFYWSIDLLDELEEQKTEKDKEQL